MTFGQIDRIRAKLVKLLKSANLLHIRSENLHKSENGEVSRKTRVDFLQVNSTMSNRNNRLRESSVNSYESDDDGYDKTYPT